jgi:agmatine deiminase
MASPTLARPLRPVQPSGFRMPAEWEPHAATWIAWPHNRADWPGKFPPIPWVYAEIVRLLVPGERVCILVQDAAAALAARRVLERNQVDLAQVEFHRQPTDRVWTRDSGPIFVRRQAGAVRELGICDFKFNAWAKYDDWKADDRLPAYVARRLKLPAWQPMAPRADGRERRVVLEGGSIDTDGEGRLLTTEECLLSEVQQRNPGLSRAGLEQVFRDHLGIEQVLWLGRGITGDDTHGHVDDLARFARPGLILLASEERRDDPNFDPLQENRRRLEALRDDQGRPFEIVALPMPSPVIFNGQRLPASYANFYIANAAVLVPVFNDPQDEKALTLLSGVFVDRPVVPVYCRDLVWGLGALHCMTQQQPAS